MTSAIVSRIITSLAIALGVAVEQKLIPDKYAGLGVILLAFLQSLSPPITRSSSDNQIARAAVLQNQNQNQNAQK